MSAAQHTPGPWTVLDHNGVFVLAEGGLTVAATAHQLDFARAPGRVQVQNARLIAAAPDLLAWIEAEYAYLADIDNNWPGRHTVSGQRRLGELRDLICEATGHTPQDLQDDYGARAALARGAA